MTADKRPTRVIVHAGFHKTGTSSLQSYLGTHRAQLKPYADIYLKPDFRRVGYLTRAYGQKPFVWRKIMFRRAFRQFLASIPDAPVIVLSWEGFCGIMPGHRRITGRSARNYRTTAIPLAREIRREATRRFGRTVELEFLYTTRATRPWLKSVWGHIVRSIDLKEDFKTFQKRFPDPDMLVSEVGHLRRALAPTPVHSAALEHLGRTHAGPATAIFNLLGIRTEIEAALPPADWKNQGHGKALETQYLNLNREIHDKSTLKALKIDLLAKAKYQATHDSKSQ